MARLIARRSASIWRDTDRHPLIMMNAFEAVALDYDGTLFDTRAAIVHCIRRAFEECGGRPIPTHDAVLDTITRGIALQDTFLILDEALRGERAVLQELVRTYRTLYLTEGTPLLKPFAGAGEVLQELHAGGAKCIVISNKGIAAICRSLDASGLSPFVALVLGDEPGIPRKPDPAIVTDHFCPNSANCKAGRY
ncbi:MAG: HAD hydrolase-like protein [Xanthobacteraceae bacterium]